MSRQSGAFGVSLALHAAALLVAFGLSGAVEQAREPRIIDLSLLQTTGGEIASLPERPAPPLKPTLPAQPPPQPRPAQLREAPPSPPPPAATSPVAPSPPAAAAEEPTPLPAAPLDSPPSQVQAEENGAPLPSPDGGSPPAAAALGEATQSLATAFPGAVAAPETSSATVPPEGAESARHEIAAAVPSAAASGGSGGRGDAGTPRDVAALRAIIKQHLVYPSVARRMGWEGKVLLSFVICGNGRARDVTLLESSGREVLDRHAQETVLKISSFPTSAAEAQVIVPVVYRLN